MSIKVSKDVKKHAVLGASSSERWLECPGSIELGKQAPPSKSSKYADEGTDAHTCFELLLKNPGKRSQTIQFLRAKYPEEMITHAAKSADWVLARIKGCDEFLIEAESSLRWIDPDMWGTTDAAIVFLFDRLIVIDFKYGAGIAVDPVDNSQAIFYALGIAHKYQYNFEEIEIVILQPRAPDGGETVKTWITTVDVLKEWAEKFYHGAKLARSENAPLKAGDHCHFCPAKVNCPEVSSRALAQAQVDFAEDTGAVAVPVPQSIAIDKLPEILKACDKLETWIEAVREHAFEVLRHGEPVAGWKLVPKRSTRKWVNATKAAKKARALFGKDAFSEPELLSPNQLEKAIGKDETTKFISKFSSSESSGLTLAPEKDKRPAVNPAAVDFDEADRQEKEVQSEVVR